MREWLEAGGFEAVYDGEAATAEEAVKRLRAGGAPLVCLCGTDDAYAGQAEAFAKALKASGAKGVALAGRPGEFERGMARRGRRRFHFRRRGRCRGAAAASIAALALRRSARGVMTS